MNSPGATIERLEWDSAFFGFGVGRIQSAQLSAEDAFGCAREARAQGIRCLYFLARSGDMDSWRSAIGAGFDPIDIRIELDCDLPSGAQLSPDCSLATGQDLPALLALTRGAFTQSRFFRDRRFPADKPHELFAEWVRRGVCDSDRFTLLSRVDGDPAGLLGGRITPEGGRIELVAVSPALQARGVGRRLMEASAAEFLRRGARRAAVVTQGSNVSAQRLYQEAGFKTRTVGVWFHGWY